MATNKKQSLADLIQGMNTQELTSLIRESLDDDAVKSLTKGLKKQDDPFREEVSTAIFSAILDNHELIEKALDNKSRYSVTEEFSRANGGKFTKKVDGQTFNATTLTVVLKLNFPKAKKADKAAGGRAPVIPK